MLSIHTAHSQSPKNLVEDRVAFAGPNAELSIYDTYVPAENVALSAGELLYCGMITGRKVLHAGDNFKAEFLPQQSFVMAPGETIYIDFPDAELTSPTTCLTVEISSQRVRQICDSLNGTKPLLPDFDTWRYDADTRIHADHSNATQQLLERMVETFTGNAADRDFLVDLGVSELVVRMLRFQTRSLVLKACQENPDLNGLSAAVGYLIKHVEQPIDIDQLRRIACMSRSRFFAEFKKHIGCTPAEFQQQQRLQKAADLLQAGHSVTEVCYRMGYQNPSHFSRRFHAFHGVSPREFKMPSEKPLE